MRQISEKPLLQVNRKKIHNLCATNCVFFSDLTLQSRRSLSKNLLNLKKKKKSLDVSYETKQHTKNNSRASSPQETCWYSNARDAMFFSSDISIPAKALV